MKNWENILRYFSENVPQFVKSPLTPCFAASPKLSPLKTENKQPRPGSAPPLELSGQNYSSPLVNRRPLANKDVKPTRSRKGSIAEMIFGADKN